jgi:ubiquitin-conjugating enzyme E2 Q
MSKRSTTASDRASKTARSSAEHGVPYLFKEYLRIDKQGQLVVETDDRDFAKWTVYVTQDVLKAHDYQQVIPYLQQWARSARRDPVIVLELSFPDAFPRVVPFVRVVRPRFQYQTGHVTLGGSVCTPLLTTSGWTPMTVDSLVASVLLNMKEGGARVQLRPDWHCGCPFVDYTALEAKEAHKRALATHGWK